MLRPRPSRLLFGLCLAGAGAQANDAAVKAAADAFGTSVGRESIGLYSSSSVRGFSPTAAGNVRIDGLYFDQVWALSARLRTTTQVRVGLNARGFAFPAPTGIVEHQLRRPGPAGQGQIATTLDSWGGAYLDLDFAQPLGDGSLGATGGLSAQRIRYSNGTQGEGYNASLALWWRPQPGREAMVFVSQHETPYDRIGPNLSPAAAELPSFRTQGRFDGPDWAHYSATARNRGLLLTETLAPAWVLRAGLFHSAFDTERDASNLILNADADGRGQHLLIIDPPGRNASDSGELRLSHAGRLGDWAQTLHLQWAGRMRERRYGGSASVDLGPGAVGEPVTLPEPALAFGPQSQDRVRQQWLGLAYELHDGRHWALNASLQHTRYRKRLQRPAQPLAEDRAQPWVGSLGGAWHPGRDWLVHAGFTRGLEESGSAPANASNRGQALPALLTTQRELGLRWQLGPGMRLMAGAFDIRKPYFNLDASGAFAPLGQVVHRGVEASLSGQVLPGMRLLAGLLWMQPRVTGEAVALGRVGARPVGQPERVARLNAVWTPAGAAGPSLDAGLAHNGPAAATRDNRVELPAATTLDLGLRWPLSPGPRPMSLRLRVANLTDAQGYELRGSGLYAEAPGRLVELGLNASW